MTTAAQLQSLIERYFASGPDAIGDPVALDAFGQFRAALERGEIRSASPNPLSPTGWEVNVWVKQGILLGFRLGVLEDMPSGGFSFVDKSTYPARRMSVIDGVRIVPGGSSIRAGAYVARGVVCMPPAYVNVGAWVDEGTMVDSHALVGSCAQIGKRVHLSAAAQVGGVLEPVNASPVIIEDDVLVGGNCGIYEGAIVRRGAVLAAGTLLTRGTPVFDLVHGNVLRSGGDLPLIIPEDAVVVPGSRAVTRGKGREWGLSLYAAVIVKYRDDKTSLSTTLEDSATVIAAADTTPSMVRWGVIGPGRAAARFAQGLAGVPGTALVSVCGRDRHRVQSYAQRFNIPNIAVTLDELFSAPVDAVYVATHPDSHAALCTAALTAGKDVLCEKPSALNVRQLESVLAAARDKSVLFMEAMKPPFFPLYQKLRAHLAADPIGPVGFVRAGHSDSTLAPDYPLHFPELGGGGILGIGPYEAFLALDWLGDLKRVQTMGRLSSAGVDSFALFQTEHQRGMAQLHTGLDLLSFGDALLCAPRGYVRIHANWWNPSRATVHYSDGREILLDEPFAHGGFNYETEHFCNLIRRGLRESPRITHALSLGMARLLEEARSALGVRFPGE